MASSENFPAIEPWTFRSPFPDSWISQSYIRDNQVSPDPPRVHLQFKSDPDLTALKRPKKKLRKSKQDTTTTFIMADPANFRQMVQQVTGERLSSNWRVAPPLKPEPQRLVQGYLPTIDTSAFLIDSKYHRRQLEGEIIVSPTTTTTLTNPSPTANFDPLSCFPTLESCSWKLL